MVGKIRQQPFAAANQTHIRAACTGDVHAARAPSAPKHGTNIGDRALPSCLYADRVIASGEFHSLNDDLATILHHDAESVIGNRQNGIAGRTARALTDQTCQRRRASASITVYAAQFVVAIDRREGTARQIDGEAATAAGIDLATTDT